MTDTTTKKKTIPRGPAATAAKNKYRSNNYDRMELAVPKGMKVRIKEIAKQQGYSSNNNYVVEAIKEKYKRDTGKELTWQKEWLRNWSGGEDSRKCNIIIEMIAKLTEV